MHVISIDSGIFHANKVKLLDFHGIKACELCDFQEGLLTHRKTWPPAVSMHACHSHHLVCPQSCHNLPGIKIASHSETYPLSEATPALSKVGLSCSIQQKSNHKNT
jgi:hypothetical protein